MAKIKNPLLILKSGAPLERTLWFLSSISNLRSYFANANFSADSISFTSTNTTNSGSMFENATISTQTPDETFNLVINYDMSNMFSGANINNLSTLTINVTSSQETISLPEFFKNFNANANLINKITINCDTSGFTLNWYSDFLAAGAKIKELELNCDFSKSIGTMFAGSPVNYNLKKISGVPVDYSGIEDVIIQYIISPNLEYIRFKPNTISAKIKTPTDSNSLEDDSIISMANALNESVTGKTLTVSNYIKGRFLAITGTVSLDSTETYHIFTADSAGTTTLSDFITNTKGWTVT